MDEKLQEEGDQRHQDIVGGWMPEGWTPEDRIQYMARNVPEYKDKLEEEEYNRGRE